MMEVSKQTLNWIATSQAPRNDKVAVIASEAWQSSE